MSLRQHHRRFKTHESFAVRFAYWNFVINGCFTLIWGIPVMALTFTDPQLAASVKWVSFLSVWALFATHAGACIDLDVRRGPRRGAARVASPQPPAPSSREHPTATGPTRVRKHG